VGLSAAWRTRTGWHALIAKALAISIAPDEMTLFMLHSR
jgi:hypothetical protein